MTYQFASPGAKSDSSTALQRRRTLLRTTALPTLRVTTTPTFAGPAMRAGGERTWTVSAGVEAAAPRRIVSENSRRPRRLTYDRMAHARSIGSQAFSALAAARREHAPAVLRRHASAKSVRAFAAPVVRFVGAFHESVVAPNPLVPVRPK